MNTVSVWWVSRMLTLNCTQKNFSNDTAMTEQKIVCCNEAGRPRKKTRIEWRHCFFSFLPRTHVTRNTRNTSCPSGRRQASRFSWIRSCCCWCFPAPLAPLILSIFLIGHTHYSFTTCYSGWNVHSQLRFWVRTTKHATERNELVKIVISLHCMTPFFSYVECKQTMTAKMHKIFIAQESYCACRVPSLATIRSKYYFNFILNRTRSGRELFDRPS